MIPPFVLSAALRRELRPTVKLAAPLAAAELGWMAMGFVDTIMAGRIDAESLGAGGLGHMLYFPIVVSIMGLLFGMDTLVSQAFGAQDQEECRRTLIDGLWLSLLLSPLAAGAFALSVPLIGLAHPNAGVLAQLGPYVRATAWGVPPLLFYNTFRRYLQSRNVVGPITFAVVSANLVNFAGNWLLMYGNWGAPRMGLKGSGISTSLSRVYMLLALGLALWRHERDAGGRILRMDWHPDWQRMRGLLTLGAPVAAQIALEGAVFAVVSVMAAKLDPVSLGAHVIGVNVISITFMVPLGISAAAAVRVGQAVGRGDPKGAAVAGWTALALAAIFMACAGAALFTVPRAIARLYSPDPLVVAAGASLLGIAAWFQLFDGQQITATGALRGMGDTRSPAVAHFVGYWIVGLPVGYLLCFRYGWGVRGLWIGLTAALVLVGAWLVLVWRSAEAGKEIRPMT